MFTEPPVPGLPAKGESPLVLLLQGLPASGKSTFAKQVVAAHPAGTVVRINNDDLSTMLFGTPWPNGAQDIAGLLAEARLGLLRAALATPSIRLIVVDNTNLVPKTLRTLAEAAHAAGARVAVDSTFLDVPVEECLARDAAREHPVGAPVIERMAKLVPGARAAARSLPAHEPVLPLSQDPSLPETVIVDVDGTLAHMDGRSPFEWHRVGEDHPNRQVVAFVQAMLAQGRHVTVMSGRDGVCREATQAWLDEHVAPGLPLHMRAAGDMRKDAIVKHELLHAHVLPTHRVVLAVDDRDQVVRMWRALGIPCWQVAPGDF